MMQPVELPRWVHKMVADVAGYFWLPCPACGRYFGGHECRDVDGHFSAIPDNEEGMSSLICPVCTAAGVGCRAYAARGKYHETCTLVPVGSDAPARFVVVQ